MGKHHDTVILDTREILYALRDASSKIDPALVADLTAAVIAAVSAAARVVAEANGCSVETWNTVDANESCFDGPDKALKKLARYADAL